MVSAKWVGRATPGGNGARGGYHLTAEYGGGQAGVGELAARPPWLEEWGGGASVENPHVQRVHYCELLVIAGCPDTTSL